MRTFLLLLAGAASLLLAGCGAGNFFDPHSLPMPPIQVAQAPPTTLNGNWLLAGLRLPPFSPVIGIAPVLSTAWFISGTQITGQGNFEVQCSNRSKVGGVLRLSGSIQNDGTFTATSGPIGVAPVITQITVTGNSPTAASPALWTGTYKIELTGSGVFYGCNGTVNSNFVAAAIAPLNGTFSGPASDNPFPGAPFGPNAQVNLQVTQGAPVLVTRGSRATYQIPLSATIDFSNSTCATTGTTATGAFPSSIGGDTLDLFFTMTDGTPLTVSGFVANSAARTMYVSLTGGQNNRCGPVPSQTTLVRQ